MPNILANILSCDKLFRPDGTPRFVLYDRARSYRPAGIRIEAAKDGKKLFQKAIFMTSGREVGLVWQQAASIWLSACGISRRSALGREALSRFQAALPAYLDRYGIDTAIKRIFVK